MLENSFLLGAVLVALLGGVSDLHSARIPNWLTYSGLATALVLRCALLGWLGLKSGAIGVGVAGGLFVLLFSVGAMGGGDVKLMACVGAWAGSDRVVGILLAAAMAGGVLAVGYMIFGQRVRRTLGNLLELICFRLTSGMRPHPVLNVAEPSTLRVPFGVAIAMGTLFCASTVMGWR